MVTLQDLLQIGTHVVAQVIETKFVIRGVGDVCFVCELFLRLLHARDGNAVGQTKEIINDPHPVCVTFGEVIVNRNHMHTAPRQGVQVDGQGRHKGFTLAGFHFRDVAFVQEDPAH